MKKNTQYIFANPWIPWKISFAVTKLSLHRNKCELNLSLTLNISDERQDCGSPDLLDANFGFVLLADDSLACGS